LISTDGGFQVPASRTPVGASKITFFEDKKDEERSEKQSQGDRDQERGGRLGQRCEAKDTMAAQPQQRPQP
ncbi:unnamed protein product, partial [Heterosigma akashiwo]